MEDKDQIIAELKAENERLKFKLDTVEADYEASEIEIEDLKNRLNLLITVNNRLLEWEANRGIIDIKHSQKGYQIFTYIHTGNYGKSIIDAVASYFCVKWQDLTEEEKQQIKEILE